MASAALALAVANSPLAGAYRAVLETHVGPLSVLHWIDDGLMAVFFLLVGLEIKRELLDGHLRQWSARVLPGLGALGGMVVPAAIYAAFNASSPETLRGVAIPSATDIAFALGVLALIGDRVPASLKVFLTALAILDDLGAIAVIGVFYTSAISAPYLLGAGVISFWLLGLNLFEIRRLSPYLILGAALWLFVLKSGVHATLAGVLLAAAIPLRLSGADLDEHTPLHRLENALQPWVAFLILPIFGFANAGVTFDATGLALGAAPVLTGIAAGLFLGKQFGVFAAVALAIKAKIATRPTHATWAQTYGVAALCGVGFTMSLFIGQIAFGSSDELMTQTKLGVFAGSLLSILLGVALLRFSAAKHP